ncbi:MAG: hypothetical protein AB7O79_13335 [Xanthobacteraceae bacterium]
MSKIDDTVATFDALARLPGNKLAECCQQVADRLNTIEGKSLDWRRAAFAWFADQFNAAVLRRDLNDNDTKH